MCRLQGHEVLEAANGAQAIELGTGGRPDLVLVDWVLPDISGTEVILELRRQGVMSPMVMLTGRSTKTDEVVGLEVGADDYITKPFDSRILAARINAHLRRSAMTEAGQGREGILSVGALQIDNAARRVKVGTEEIPLTMTEFNLLAVLAANPERVLTRAQLRDKVWGYPHDLDDHSVDPHVQRLRRKLSDLAHPGVSLEAVPATREDDAETASIIVNRRKGLYEHGHSGDPAVPVSNRSQHLNMVPRICTRRQGSCQARAEHFEQCAEFPLLSNRGPGSLAATILPTPRGPLSSQCGVT